MVARRALAWLPNVITSLRLVAVIPVFVCAILGAWAVGFWILVAALVTDFFDGLFARKLKVQSNMGAKFDGLSDTLLGAATLSGLTITGLFPPLAFGGVVAGAVILQISELYSKKLKDLTAIRPMFEVGCLFMTIVYSLWTYAIMAFGWFDWYVPLTILTLITLAILKRNRLRVWCSAILPEKWRLNTTESHT